MHIILNKMVVSYWVIFTSQLCHNSVNTVKFNHASVLWIQKVCVRGGGGSWMGLSLSVRWCLRQSGLGLTAPRDRITARGSHWFTTLSDFHNLASPRKQSLTIVSVLLFSDLSLLEKLCLRIWPSIKSLFRCYILVFTPAQPFKVSQLIGGITPTNFLICLKIGLLHNFAYIFIYNY